MIAKYMIKISMKTVIFITYNVCYKNMFKILRYLKK